MVTRFRGGIAQLGERLNGIQEVSGSIPLTSTNLIEYMARRSRFVRTSTLVLRILETHSDRIE